MLPRYYQDSVTTSKTESCFVLYSERNYFKRFTLICTKLQQMQIGYSNLRRTTNLDYRFRKFKFRCSKERSWIDLRGERLGFWGGQETDCHVVLEIATTGFNRYGDRLHRNRLEQRSFVVLRDVCVIVNRHHVLQRQKRKTHQLRRRKNYTGVNLKNPLANFWIN